MLPYIYSLFKPKRLKLILDTNNIVFIVPRLPEYDRASGDLRLVRIIQMLLPDYNIYLYNFGNTERFLNNGESKYLDYYENLGITVILNQRDFTDMLKNTKTLAVVIEFYNLALKFTKMIRRLAPEAKVIVDSVDVHYLREKLKAETLKTNTLPGTQQRAKKQELNSYRNADYVWTVSQFDKDQLLKEKIPEDKIHIVPNIHKIEGNPRPFNTRNRNTILFIGGFLHQPNADAIEYFCNTILPLVTEKVPDAKLLVVGDSPPESIKNLAGKNVEVIGYVPDTMPYLNSAIVSVAPLRYGAGLKGKVCEALAAGLPLVTTSIGAQGMELGSGSDCFIADDPADFARAVIRLLNEPELWNKFSHNGRMFMDKNFGFDGVVKLLTGFFKQLSLT